MATKKTTTEAAAEIAAEQTEQAEVQTEVQTEQTKPAEQTVRVRLPLTRTQKDDVFVGLNGRTFLIKRGVDVDVPAGVAEILQHQEEALSTIMEFEDAAAGNLKALEER